MKSFPHSTRLIRASLLAIAGALTAFFAVAGPLLSADPKPGNKRVLKTATIQLPNYSKPTKITYEERDGMAVFEGDIVLNLAAPPVPRPAFVPRDEAGREMGSASKLDSQSVKLSVVYGGLRLWPKGVVPYTINANVGEDLKRNINAAIEVYHKKTNLKFTPRTTEQAYVEFLVAVLPPEVAGRSSLGRQGTLQIIELQATATLRTLVHEIGHAIGLCHEHTRSDRDKHVKILWDNIIEDYKYNFDTQADADVPFGPYDFNSVMHYWPDAYGKDDGKSGVLTTIQPLDPKVSIQPGNTLSKLDVEQLNRLYPKARECPADGDGVPNLYHHPKFKDPVPLTRDAPNLDDLGIDDRATGVRVPVGWSLTLYRHPNYEGESITFDGPHEVPDLTKVVVTNSRGRPVSLPGLGAQRLTWNDQASSARVAGPCANIPPHCDAPTLFEHASWRGRQLRLEESVRNLKVKDYKFNDITSSLCVPDGWSIRLYEHDRYKGPSIEIIGPMTLEDLHRGPDCRNWGDKFTSVVVTKFP